jgi:multiple sugar transport system permease protein
MMMGIISPQERRTRRVAAGIVLTCMLIIFGFVFRRIMRTFTPSDIISNNKGTWQFLRYRWSYLILMPAVVSVIFWGYVPLLRGSYMAFFDYKLLGKSAFVGIDNFGDLLFDSLWWQACWNSARYSFFVIGMTFLPPILLAIALQEVPGGKLLYRLIFYLPAVITGIVTVLLWKQFYEPSENGALNALMMRIPAIGFLGFGVAMMLGFFAFARRLRIHEMWAAMFCFIIAGIGVLSVFAGLAMPILFPPAETFAESLPHLCSRLFIPVPEPYRWLTDTKTAMFSCVLPAVWAGMGPGCLIYLAALKGIPDDYYEAADIDGAGFIDKIIFVVFPTLKALIIINFVGVFINSWYGAAGSILAMTGGQANTETVGLHIWYKAFTFLKFGSATAGAWMLGFMMIGFTINQLRILSRVEFRAQGTDK